MSEITYKKTYSDKYSRDFDEGKCEPNLSSIKHYFLDRVAELESLADRGDPWVFGSCCTFIDVLSWAVYFDRITTARVSASGNPCRAIGDGNLNQTGKTDYKNFLVNYFFNANLDYNSLASQLFTENFQDNLADKMYGVLRCGVVHSFSMKQNMNVDNDAYGIVLAHKTSEEDERHLKTVKLDFGDGDTIDSFILLAQPFVNDIKNCVDYVMFVAESDTGVATSMINLFKNKPPMGFLSFILQTGNPV